MLLPEKSPTSCIRIKKNRYILLPAYDHDFDDSLIKLDLHIQFLPFKRVSESRPITHDW